MTTDTDSPDTGSREKQRPLYVDVLARLFIGFTVLALFSHFVAHFYVIPSGSMEPTLVPGDRGVGRILGVDEEHLGRGEVVIFQHGESWDSDRIEESNPAKNLLRYAGDFLGVGPSHHAYTVKRIVGLPGETVSCCDDGGRILVDGEPLEEPYVTMDLPFTEDPGCASSGSAVPSRRCFPEVTVPKGSYLVLGDNRANSADSVYACRGLGADQPCEAMFVRADRVLATAGVRLWPLPPGDALRDPDLR